MSMSSPQAASEGDNEQRQKREEVFHRSLRECTTSRLTHFNPCTQNALRAPTLTSRVQWTSGRVTRDDVPVKNIEDDMIDAEEDVEGANLSPVLSEIDELDPSDDEQVSPNSRPSTGVQTASYPLSAHQPTVSGDDARSVHSYSDSSDTERRQPNFPGNRDIIDSRFPSTSPSPPTQHSAELETPSPVSDTPAWGTSHKSQTSTALGLQIRPNVKLPSRDDRNDRIGTWRAESTDRINYHGPTTAYDRYGLESTRNVSRGPRPDYSPSMSASSTPPSPLPTLPSIHHLNATLPVSTGSTPGVMQWRFRESVDPRNVKRIRQAYLSADDEYDDARSSTASPRSLPPLLPHIKMVAQGYPSQHQLAPVAPVTSPAPPAPALNPPRNKNAWKDYAQVIQGPNEQTEFRCVWRVGYAGQSTDHCGYTAKRHLVKRHIETRHLQFKDHICSYCGKAFPQRVSLMIHVNRHTGAKPHPCRYVDCDKTFSDPARRHKHMVEAHGYNPQGPRKRHRTVDSYHVNTFESVASWTAKEGSREGSVIAP